MHGVVAELAIDHEASKNDSIFLRGNFQHRDPNSIQYEGGSALTNLVKLQESVKKQKDIIKLTCVNDKLVRLLFFLGALRDASVLCRFVHR